MRKRFVFIGILLWSLFFNIVLVVLLYYVIRIKTDFYDRLCAKMGYGSYSVVKNRHSIEHRCLEGWANSLSKMNIEADAVFYGNSITFRSDFRNDYPKLCICNMGCNRDDLDDMIHRSFLIKSVHPHKIFILGGINGLKDYSLQDFRKKYELLIDTIIKQNPNSKLFLQSLLPVNINYEIGSRYVGFQDKIKDANIIIQKIAEKKQCSYLDIYSLYHTNDSMPCRFTSDGLHLKPEAYSIWSRYLYSYLNE